MAFDLATIGVRVTTDGIDKATRDLAALAKSGATAERATKSLGTAQSDLTARAQKLAAVAHTIDLANRRAVTAMVTEIASVRALAQGFGTLTVAEQHAERALATINARTRENAVAMGLLTREASTATRAKVALGAASGVTASQMNALRASMTSVAAAALSAAPGVAQLSGVIGTMALGSGVMVGVMAGAAALGFAWDKISEKARTAAKEQDDAIRRLDEFRKRERQGADGQTGEDVAGRRAQLASDRAKLAAMQNRVDDPFAAGKGVRSTGVAAARAALVREMAETQARIVRGEREINDAIVRSSEDRAARQINDLASVVAAGKASAAEMQTAKTVALSLEQALAATAGDPSKTGERARLIAQLRELNDALHPKATRSGSTSRTTGDREMDAITAAIREQAGEEARRDAARTKAAGDYIAQQQQELSTSILLLDAAKQGEDAYQAQQREIEVLNRLTAAGLVLGDARYEQAERDLRQTLANRDATDALAAARKRDEDAAKRQAEDAQRNAERRLRDIQRTTSSAINQILTDISNRRNPFVALMEGVKAGIIRMISDLLAAKWGEKIAGAIGLSTPAQQQAKAGEDMRKAAEMQKKAAEDMLRAQGIDPSKTTQTGAGGTATAMQQKWATMMGYGAIGYGGFQAGRGTGAMIGGGGNSAIHYAAGGIGGGMSGAMMGATLGNVLPGIGTVTGAVIGGLAGVVGGLMGVSDAAAASARRLEAARKAFQISMDALRALVDRNDLDGQIATANAEREALREQARTAMTVYEIIDNYEKYKKSFDDINTLTEKRIALLTKEAAVLRARQAEDFIERALRAQGKDTEAARYAFENRQRREREDVERSMGEKVGDKPGEQAVWDAMMDAHRWERLQFATDAATGALDAFTTSVRNAPSGFKVERYVQRYATPVPMGRGFSPEGFAPPMTPTWPTPTAPALGSVSITVIESKTPELTAQAVAKMLFSELDKTKRASLGPNATRAAALEIA